MEFYFVAVIIINGLVSGSSVTSRVPLYDTFHAPLVVELNMSHVNKQIKEYIDPELDEIQEIKTSLFEFDKRIYAELRDLKKTIDGMMAQIGGLNLQRPAFSASIEKDTSFGKGQPFKFLTVHVNIGNMYNSKTGIAVIPSGGNYLINWHVLTNSGYSTYPYLKVNNVYRSSAACDARGSNGARIACGNTVILTLKKGDQMWIEEWTGNSGTPNVQMGFSTFTVTKL